LSPLLNHVTESAPPLNINLKTKQQQSRNHNTIIPQWLPLTPLGPMMTCQAHLKLRRDPEALRILRILLDTNGGKFTAS
jgi:hypothetical protein